MPHRDFAAADARLLRASLSAFMDLLALATRTLETFPAL
jgi:tRNA threonylcarbamoyladenosine modification (KEOPS) complex  Pcc1 subunit